MLISNSSGITGIPVRNITDLSSHSKPDFPSLVINTRAPELLSTVLTVNEEL